MFFFHDPITTGGGDDVISGYGLMRKRTDSNMTSHAEVSAGRPEPAQFFWRSELNGAAVNLEASHNASCRRKAAPEVTNGQPPRSAEEEKHKHAGRRHLVECGHSVAGSGRAWAARVPGSDRKKNVWSKATLRFRTSTGGGRRVLSVDMHK